MKLRRNISLIFLTAIIMIGMLPISTLSADATEIDTTGACIWSDDGIHTYDHQCDPDCNACGDIRTITHDYADATCTQPQTCNICGATSGEKLEHDYWTEYYINDTNHWYQCQTCGDQKDLETHSFTNNCDNSCNVCGAVRTTTHIYKTTTTKATLSKDGSIVKKCTVCDKVSSKTTIKRAKTFKLSTTTYAYNGKVKTPNVTVKDSAGKALKKNTDYSVTYASGRKNVGTYKVTVKLKGKYSGTKTLTFKINPSKTTVSKLTAGKTSIMVAITKKSTQVTGYQIQYSTSKTFSKTTTKTISSYKTTKYTLKSLSTNRTYYIRVRTYKTVGKTKYYSGWSSYKAKKTATIIKNVPNIAQLPKYPTGCESVSAVIALKYSGTKISVKKFVKEYLPKDKKFYYKNGKLYGPSPYEFFVGDPTSTYSYGCMAPVLKKAISKCVGKSAQVKSLGNYTLSKICKKYIDAGKPVIVWATVDMKKVRRVNSWYLKNGKRFTWPGNEHCMVLVGYDDENYYFNDPYQGKTVAYKKSLAEKRFADLGKQALVILPK